jgi:hypothetical protein
MAKKDLNYIKFIKPQIREKEKQMRSTTLNNRMMQRIAEINVYHPEHDPQKEVCKAAAKMSSRERLINYAVTKDPTYLGVGCKWDLLTQWGRDKFGRVIGSIL